MNRFLLVRSGARRLALPLEGVEEILPVDALLPAPVNSPAVRGLLTVRERLVPLAHLGALLDDAAPPDETAEAAVLITAGGHRVALEVDATDDLIHADTDPMPGEWDLPWAGGVARHQGTLMPVVELEVLVERLLAGAGGRQ